MPTFEYDIKLGTKVAQLKTADYGDKSITINKLAEEIWNKLKSEYLRLDGTNRLAGNLNMGGKNIIEVGTIETNEVKERKALGVAIRLEDSIIKFGQYEVNADYNPSFEEFANMDMGDLTMQGFVYANGYFTNIRTNLGLLNNNGEVILSMSDTEIDDCFASVFTN